MTDDCTSRKGRLGRAPGSNELPAQLVDVVRVNLRATDPYIGALIEQLEIARIVGLRNLDPVPAGSLAHLVADLNAVQASAHRVLRSIDPEIAEAASLVASLFLRGRTSGAEAGSE